jgi:hypothetical protein
VPTVPLVSQQRKLIASYLSAKYEVVGISGGSHEDLNSQSHKILNAQVIVMYVIVNGVVVFTFN